MALKSFNMYHSYLKSIEPLNDAERGRLFTALLEYSSTGEAPELRGNERFIFPMMKEQIDMDAAKYAAKCSANKKNIDKRWYTTVYDGIPNDTKNTKDKDKDKEKDKDKDKESVKENAHTLFARIGAEYNLSPTLRDKVSEWLTYKSERRESYKPQGLKSLLRQIENNYLHYGDVAVCRLIDDSMANGWKGIIFERLQKQGTQRGRLDWIDDV